MLLIHFPHEEPTIIFLTYTHQLSNDKCMVKTKICCPIPGAQKAVESVKSDKNKQASSDLYGLASRCGFILTEL